MATTINKAPATRQTVKEWQEVATKNAVARRISTARFKLGDLGQHGGVGLRALYIAGPPGVGKTHSIVEQEAIWRSRGLEPLRFRPQSARELLDYFAQARGCRPLIMEEADIIFRSKPMFEILKQATDPLTPDFLSRVEKVDGQKVEVKINLNVPVVVSTNLDLLSDTGWDRALLADRDALFNRSRPIVIPNDPISLWEWSIYLALTSHLTKNVSIRNKNGGKPVSQAIPLDVQAMALDWFTQNLNELIVISPRTLKQVAQLIGRAHHKDMPEPVVLEELAGLLGPTRENPVAVSASDDWEMLLQSTPKTQSPAPRLAA